MVKRSSRQSLRIEFEMKGFGWNSSANSNGHNNRIEAVVFWFPNVALSSLKDNQFWNEYECLLQSCMEGNQLFIHLYTDSFFKIHFSGCRFLFSVFLNFVKWIGLCVSVCVGWFIHCHVISIGLSNRAAVELLSRMTHFPSECSPILMQHLLFQSNKKRYHSLFYYCGYSPNSVPMCFSFHFISVFFFFFKSFSTKFLFHNSVVPHFILRNSRFVDLKLFWLGRWVTKNVRNKSWSFYSRFIQFPFDFLSQVRPDELNFSPLPRKILFEIISHLNLLFVDQQWETPPADGAVTI